jgi:hypothetical protein
MGRLIKGKTFYNKPWYNSYKAMMDRCYRENASNYANYGGRGIEVCEEWHDIEKFEKWVEESNYEKGLTIDRIDVDGNYEPSNCRWATKKEQDNNRRNTVYVEYNGECHTISEWAEITGVNRSTLNNRYYRGIRGEKLFEKLESCKGMTWNIVDGRREWEKCV